jgi:di/tricarboxylate transporter
MSFDQAAAFAVILGMVGLFVWGRIRYDLVAVLALSAAIVCGIVPAEAAFKGFGSDIVIIVASALVVSAAISRSGAVEIMMRPLAPRLRTTGIQIGVLAGLVAVLSAFMKNIGALAIFIPAAVQISRRSGKPASRLLMPLSFASLLGGLMTLIGTSPNIIVSQLRQDLLGEPFGMFDFLPVGAGLAAAGVLFLSVGWRLLPRDRSAPVAALTIDDYTTEIIVPANSPFVGRTVYDLEEAGEGDVVVAAIIREKVRRYVPSGHWVIFANDMLVLECDTAALERIVNRGGFKIASLPEGRSITESRRERIGIVEAVVAHGSPLIGRTAETLRMRERYGITLMGLSRRGRPIRQRLRRIRFQAGDLLVLMGRTDTINETLGTIGCLALSERNLRLNQGGRRSFLPVLVLGVALAAMAAGIATVQVAFFITAVMMVALRFLTLPEAYASLDWPLLILLGALIPVSEALQTTGATEIIAEALSHVAGALPAIGAVAFILVAAMAVTPFLNNAATVLVMAPIGAGLAQRLGLDPDPFLMAVAIGAACDFLTPIGHQCNTLVMGPGGYRFSDYWRLGLPLSALVVVLGTLLIAMFWPLMPMR